MRCERCGRDFPSGSQQCSYCGAAAHYGGNTEFYFKAANSQLSFKDFFKDSFKKHEPGAGAKVFMSGTPLSTPSPDQMLSEWQKPWLWARVLILGLIFCAILYISANYMDAPLYALFSLGALVIPISILIFFWEANIPRDIPLYTLIVIFLIGGALSIAFVPFVPALGEAASFAAFVEEPTKLLALSIFIYKLDKKYIFDGILIGAAVGTGFAGMENIYYIFAMGSPMEVFVLRSVLSLGGHIMWAAAEGGALAMVKGSDKLQLKHFGDKRFLVYLGASMALHFTWNSNFGIVSIPLFGDVKYVILCGLAMFSVFTLMKQAIKQVLNAADLARFQYRPQPQKQSIPVMAKPMQAVLMAQTGPLAGTRFPFQKTVAIGRDPSVCNVILPNETPGISRRHCLLEIRPDGVYVMDVSSNGTFWLSGARIPPNTWVKVTEPICLGSRAVSFHVEYPVL